MDAGCLLRAIDAAAARKSLKQAWIFSATHIITLSGLCIHRKAINKDKPTHPLAYCYITRAKWFIPVYRLGEDGDLLKEGGGMLSVWVLRACSYKTRAEA